jgi:hypothetical protein
MFQKKKVLIVILCSVLIFSLCSCGGTSIYEKEREAKREAAYNDGYEAGFDEGRTEGIINAQQCFENYVFNLSYDIKDEYEMTPEEAITILAHYADGEPISEKKLNKAIWTINGYYWTLDEAIRNLDKYFP